MRLILTLSLLLLLLPAAAAAQVDGLPTATTEPATDVQRTSATLNGTVDPNDAATTYRFEYGTTAALGQATPEQDAGSGGDPVPAEAALDGLSPDTTYHYELVATNTNGTTRGGVKTFRTEQAPRAPGVTRTGTAQNGPDSAIVRSTIDPNGAETTYQFEYGRTRSFGSRTPDRTLAEGETGVDVTETLAGLQPFRRYYFRLVATNSAGTSRSQTRSLVTARQPTAITLDVDGRTPWGEGIEVFGQVSGAGINGIPVGLERQEFDFTGPFSSVGTPFPVRADGRGRFRIFVPSLFATTRLRAITHTAVQVISEPVTAPVTVVVGARQSPEAQARADPRLRAARGPERARGAPAPDPDGALDVREGRRRLPARREPLALRVQRQARAQGPALPRAGVPPRRGRALPGQQPLGEGAQAEGQEEAPALAPRSACSEGTSQRAPSGGSVTSAENGCECQPIGSACTPPRLPTSEPP